MKNLISTIGKRGLVLSLAVIGITAGYMLGTSPEATASAPSKQTCTSSASCKGGDCTTKENCRKTSCGCGCVNKRANP